MFEGLAIGMVVGAVGLGFRHGIDWDHLAALADLTGYDTSRRRRLLLATSYALGHAAVVLVLGLAAILLGASLPEGIDDVMERVVGLTLVVLGAWVLVSLVRQGRDFRLRSRWMLVSSGIARNVARLRRDQVVVVEHDHPHDHAAGADHGHVHLDHVEHAAGADQGHVHLDQVEHAAGADQGHVHLDQVDHAAGADQGHVHLDQVDHAAGTDRGHVHLDHLGRVDHVDHVDHGRTGNVVHDQRTGRSTSGPLGADPVGGVDAVGRARRASSVLPTRAAHSHRHRHVGVLRDPFAEPSLPVAAGIGCVHGIGAETPTQLVILTTAAGAQGQVAGVAFLLAFVVGLVASNTTVASAMAVGRIDPERSFAVYATLSVVIAVFSIVAGTAFLLGAGAALPAISGS